MDLWVHQSPEATHVVLVHREANEMSRLKAALIRSMRLTPTIILRYNPRNTVAVELYSGEKMAS